MLGRWAIVIFCFFPFNFAVAQSIPTAEQLKAIDPPKAALPKHDVVLPEGFPPDIMSPPDHIEHLPESNLPPPSLEQLRAAEAEMKFSPRRTSGKDGASRKTFSFRDISVGEPPPESGIQHMEPKVGAPPPPNALLFLKALSR